MARRDQSETATKGMQMSRFRGHKSLADYVESLPGDSRTCVGCAMWQGSSKFFDCPKGGLVHRAQVMRCHSRHAIKTQEEYE